MNLYLFLLNELMEDAVLAQQVGNPFTYSCLLILITLVGWMEPTHYQGMEVDDVNICRGAQCKDLWEIKNKERKTDINIQFYLYLDALQDVTVKILRLIDEAASKYYKVA